MPSTYAHYVFGQEIRKHLRADIEKIISDNLELYNIGLHGPDILFYYKPLKSNPISKTGSKIHFETADIFFNNGKEVARKSADVNAGLSYLLGFICHFMLDSECHPYVSKKMEESNVPHNLVEVEFDRALMIKDGLNPIKFEPTGHIVPSMDYAKTIAPFFPRISTREIAESLRSMKFYLNLLVVKNKFKRFILATLLKIVGKYETMGSLLLFFEPNPACKDSSTVLEKLHENSIIPTAQLITEFYDNFYSDKALNKRFFRDFE